MKRLLFVFLLLCVSASAQIRLGGNVTAGSTIPTYTVATLPTPTTGNNCARVSDGQRGIWCDNGTAWEPIRGRGNYDVADFNNGDSDYADDFQAAINAIPATGDTGNFGDTGHVFVGAKGSGYFTSKPILLHKNSMAFEGVGYTNATVIRSDGTWYGPVLNVAPANYPAVPTQASLASGGGLAYVLNGTSFEWINLRPWVPVLDLNGLTQLDVDFNYKPAADSTGSFSARCLTSSSGRVNASATIDVAYQIYQHVNNTIRASIKIGSTVHTLTTPDNTLTVNSTAHVEMSYDGSTVRLFVNGALAASEAATGTITQRPWEDVMIGPATTDWPEATFFNPAADGAIGNVHISNIARHTSAYTNPCASNPCAAPPSPDANTLILMNFDEFYGNMIVARSGATKKAYIPFHYNGALATGALIGHVQIKNLDIYSNDSVGIAVTSMVYGDFRNLYLSGARVGLFAYDNDFGLAFRDSQVVNSAPANLGSNGSGAMFIAQAGLIRTDNVQLNGGTLPFVHVGGSGEHQDLQISPNYP